MSSQIVLNAELYHNICIQVEINCVSKIFERKAPHRTSMDAAFLQMVKTTILVRNGRKLVIKGIYSKGYLMDLCQLFTGDVY